MMKLFYLLIQFYKYVGSRTYIGLVITQQNKGSDSTKGEYKTLYCEYIFVKFRDYNIY